MKELVAEDINDNACPRCNKEYEEDSATASTKGTQSLDEGYEWTELHFCKDCNIYFLKYESS